MVYLFDPPLQAFFLLYEAAHRDRTVRARRLLHTGSDDGIGGADEAGAALVAFRLINNVDQPLTAADRIGRAARRAFPAPGAFVGQDMHGEHPWGRQAMHISSGYAPRSRRKSR